MNNPSVKEIKERIENLDTKDYLAYADELRLDPRKSVQKLGDTLVKKHEKIVAEQERMTQILMFEREAYEKGYTFVVGLDEAGRGPLVGPVVAGAVVLDLSKDWTGINDSKKLSEKQREYFYDKIKAEAICYGIGVATHEEIDEINILEATKLAMKRAIYQIADVVEPDFLLIDAVKLADIEVEQLSLIKGDSRSASIAAASILAKVTRDHMLYKLHEEHPQYHFDSHKGYGTDAHYNAIRQYGLIPEHRRSFLKNFKG